MIAAALLMLAGIAPAVSGDTTLRLPRGGTVVLEAGFRDVIVTVGTSDQVRIVGASAELHGNRISIESMAFLSGRGGEPLRLTLPSWAKLEVTVLNGNLEVKRAPESLAAEVVNGSIVTHGGTGTMTLSSATGAITVHEFAGRLLDVEAISGSILIDGASGRIRAESVNNPITMRAIRSNAVNAASVNGRIEWSGPLVATGRYHFESHNGDIDLQLPPAISARVHVSTFMGRFTSSLPANSNGQGRRDARGLTEREFTAVYGAGDAEVWVETFNGNIRVRPQGER